LAPSHGQTSLRKTILVLVVLALALGGYFGWRRYGGQASESAGAAKGQAAAAIPVTFAKAEIADFPVYLNSLGIVTPYDTVTVRSRVDGEVVKVGFRQGQMVKEGDVLVQIDPRPYQAALDQALAKKAQDEANLKNAQLNLQRYDTLAKQDFASKQQLDTQQATVDQLVAQIKGEKAPASTDTGVQLITDKPVPGLPSKTSEEGLRMCWG